MSAARELFCHVCETEFADPNPDEEFPHGIICPECRKRNPGGLVGVIHPRKVEPVAGQEDGMSDYEITQTERAMDRLIEERDRLRSSLREAEEGRARAEAEAKRNMDGWRQASYDHMRLKESESTDTVTNAAILGQRDAYFARAEKAERELADLLRAKKDGRGMMYDSEAWDGAMNALGKMLERAEAAEARASALAGALREVIDDQTGDYDFIKWTAKRALLDKEAP